VLEYWVREGAAFELKATPEEQAAPLQASTKYFVCSWREGASDFARLHRCTET
jgi:hypothetical protein